MKKRHSLGAHLRQAREALGFSLREVEAQSKNQISNGYLCQIEMGAMEDPSPKILKTLSEILSLDYVELLILAGHLTKKDLH